MKIIVLWLILLHASGCHFTYSSITGRDVDNLIVLWSPDKQAKELLKYEKYFSNKTDMENMSSQHGKRGFRLLKKGDFSNAVSEFNKSWLFNQKNYIAYWGGASICYEYAMASPNELVQILYLEESVCLLREVKKLIPQEEYIYWGNDYALALASLAALEKKRSETRANIYFLEAQEILDQLLKTDPNSGSIILTKSIYCYYKGEYADARIFLQQAKKRGYTSRELESDLEAISNGPKIFNSGMLIHEIEAKF